MYMMVLVDFVDRGVGSGVVQDRNRADCHPSNRPCSTHACAGPCNKPLRRASVIDRHDLGWEDQSSPVNGRRRLLIRLSTGRSDLWCLALHLCSRLRSVSVNELLGSIVRSIMLRRRLIHGRARQSAPHTLAAASAAMDKSSSLALWISPGQTFAWAASQSL